MNSAIFNPCNAALISTGEITELVRGQDQALVAWLSPMVRRQSVTLDLGAVERIDAAGIAALISLYGIAMESGHGFTVANPSAHVKEILTLVGLDGILVSHRASRTPRTEACIEWHAA